MLECKICGTKFNAVIERHYLARDNGKTGLAVAFGSTAEECLYDAFDCPMCGCQVIAKERKRDYISFVKEDENYYERDADRVRAGSVGNRRNTPDYDDILFDTRGDAEAVLDAMNDIISQYGTVSVSDFYDLARVPNDNFTMNRYGWTNIGGATAVRVRDGYILKLPRAIPLN